MTQDKQFKLEVRRYATEHGLAYTDARRRVLAERESRGPSEPDIDGEGPDGAAPVTAWVGGPTGPVAAVEFSNAPKN